MNRFSARNRLTYTRAPVQTRSRSPHQRGSVESPTTSVVLESQSGTVNRTTEEAPNGSTNRRVAKRNSGFLVSDYYDLTDDRKNHRCKFNGCNKVYRVSTSTSHKKNHAELHKTTQTKAYHEWDSGIKLEYIIMLIVTRGLTYHIVEDSIFRLVTGTNFSRKLISETVRKQYEDKKQIVRHMVNSIEHLSLTTDIWTCSTKSNEAFACYTAHYFENGEVKQVLLDFMAMPESHSGSYLNIKLRELIEYYDIERRITSVTTDRASNNNSAMQLLNAHQTYLNLPHVEQINCFCHVINNVVQHSTKTLDATIEKARNVCLTIKRSSNLSRKLENACRKWQIKSKKLLIDVDTRWNSLYLMLERMVQLRIPLNELMQDELLLAEFLLLENQWDQIKEAIEFLKPFYEYTVEMSKSSEFTFSGAVVYFRLLIKHTEETLRADETNQMVKVALDKLKTYLPKIETSYSLTATFLDPFMSKHLRSSEKEEIEQRVRSLLNSVEPYHSRLPEKSTRGILTIVGLDEIEQYTQTQQPNSSMSIAKWWEENKMSYPRLYNLAKKFMIIRPSSVSAESTFSIASWLVSSRRNRLSDDSITACLFLHEYFSNPANMSDS